MKIPLLPKLFFLCTGFALPMQSEANEPNIVSRVENGAYVPFTEVLQWIQDHPKDAVRYPVFKKIVLKECNKTKNPIKERSLKAAGWWDEWVKTGYDSLHAISSEFIQGDFTHDPSMLFTVLREEAPSANPFELLRHQAPLALMQSFASKGELDALKKAPKKDLAKIEQELLRAKPGQAFWLGGNWNKSQFEDLKRIFPALFETAKKECEAYFKDDRKDPPHVSTNGCDLLFRELGLAKPAVSAERTKQINETPAGD
ncbi:MAG: hypothetical protein EBX52_08770 [Proteobacteria bacterium]|nr:hypothetical protein [Pseudomonadota bacterium]